MSTNLTRLVTKFFPINDDINVLKENKKNESNCQQQIHISK